MDNLRMVPGLSLQQEAIRNLNPANAVSVAEHPVTISPMNDSRFIPAIPAVYRAVHHHPHPDPFPFCLRTSSSP